MADLRKLYAAQVAAQGNGPSADSEAYQDGLELFVGEALKSVPDGVTTVTLVLKGIANMQVGAMKQQVPVSTINEFRVYDAMDAGQGSGPDARAARDVKLLHKAVEWARFPPYTEPVKTSRTKTTADLFGADAPPVGDSEKRHAHAEYWDFLDTLDRIGNMKFLTQDTAENLMLPFRNAFAQPEFGKKWGGTAQPLKLNIESLKSVTPLKRPAALTERLANARLDVERRIVSEMNAELGRINASKSDRSKSKSSLGQR